MAHTANRVGFLSTGYTIYGRCVQKSGQCGRGSGRTCENCALAALGALAAATSFERTSLPSFAACFNARFFCANSAPYAATSAANSRCESLLGPSGCGTNRCRSYPPLAWMCSAPRLAAGFDAQCLTCAFRLGLKHAHTEDVARRRGRRGEQMRCQKLRKATRATGGMVRAVPCRAVPLSVVICSTPLSGRGCVCARFRR